MVKISDAVKASFDILDKSIPSARFEAELIAGYVLKADRLHLLMCKNDTVSVEDYEKIISLSKLRSSNMPFSYITGTKEFMSLEFKVNKNVLIPRPETEELVSHMTELLKDKSVRILDLCTGSGAICCSLARFLPRSFCLGADISRDALKIARENAKSLNVSDRTDFIFHDVLNPDFNFEKSDVLVSNPPYIETKEIAKLEETVKSFEPLIALDGGEDGLIFYRQIAKNIDRYLKNGGMAFFEIGYNQGEALKNILSEKFTDVKILKDLSGNDRIAYGQLA